MSLLFSEEIKEKLVKEIRDTQSSLNIVSAYCKESGIKFIESNITQNVEDKKLLVRFTFDDIVSGASDLSVYDFCRQNGWKLYVRFDLHAKTYIFDKLRCIIGSANLTSRGIGLKQGSNFEIAQLAEISTEEMKKIDMLFNTAILMTDDLFNLMKADLCNRTMGNIKPDDNWSEDVLSLFEQKVEVLFTYEFPNCFSLSEMKYDSLDFLGVGSEWNINTVKNAFIRCNAYRWLVDKLNSMPNKEIYFGNLSAELHNAIVNDPKPYRKEVKELQANLLNWIIELGVEQIMIDRPNHSQRIRLR